MRRCGGGRSIARSARQARASGGAPAPPAPRAAPRPMPPRRRTASARGRPLRAHVHASVSRPGVGSGGAGPDARAPRPGRWRARAGPGAAPVVPFPNHQRGRGPAQSLASSCQQAAPNGAKRGPYPPGRAARRAGCALRAAPKCIPTHPSHNLSEAARPHAIGSPPSQHCRAARPAPRTRTRGGPSAGRAVRGRQGARGRRALYAARTCARGRAPRPAVGSRLPAAGARRAPWRARVVSLSLSLCPAPPEEAPAARARCRRRTTRRRGRTRPGSGRGAALSASPHARDSSGLAHPTHQRN
jgi:hypothetical protein